MPRSTNFGISPEVPGRFHHFSLKIGLGKYLDLTDWSKILGGELYHHENLYPERAVLIFDIFSLFSLIFSFYYRLCFETSFSLKIALGKYLDLTD